MNEFISTMNQINKICEKHFKFDASQNCISDECPLSYEKNGMDKGCMFYLREHPEDAATNVKHWLESNEL